MPLAIRYSIQSHEHQFDIYCRDDVNSPWEGTNIRMDYYLCSICSDDLRRIKRLVLPWEVH